MVIDMGGEHIGVSYGKIKRTPGQLDCERAREIFEGVQPQAVRIGLTVAEDIDEISENLREAMPGRAAPVRRHRRHQSGRSGGT